MVIIIYGGHGCGYHLSLEAGETPGFSGELHNPLHCNLDTLFFFGIGKMLDGVDDLLDHSPSSCVDPLLGTTACKCGQKCLLAPYGLFACALVTDMIAH